MLRTRHDGMDSRQVGMENKGVVQIKQNSMGRRKHALNKYKQKQEERLKNERTIRMIKSHLQLRISSRGCATLVFVD